MMACRHNLNDAYDLAMRVGRGAARDYIARRGQIEPERQEEFLGFFIIGLEETLSSMIIGRADALPDIVEAAIEAFVKETECWPALAADQEQLFDFERLIA